MTKDELEKQNKELIENAERLYRVLERIARMIPKWNREMPTMKPLWDQITTTTKQHKDLMKKIEKGEG